MKKLLLSIKILLEQKAKRMGSQMGFLVYLILSLLIHLLKYIGDYILRSTIITRRKQLSTD